MPTSRSTRSSSSASPPRSARNGSGASPAASQPATSTHSSISAREPANRMKALVFVDITDPWSYIGATRFERAAAMFSILTGEPIEFTLRAYQLEPDEPSEGRPLMDALAERLGGLDKAEFVNVQVTAGAKITGIDLNFDEAVQA